MSKNVIDCLPDSISQVSVQVLQPLVRQVGYLIGFGRAHLEESVFFLPWDEADQEEDMVC